MVQVVQYSAVPQLAAFGGNPNAAISAINTSGGIASSRTSGYTPAFVQVSASAITATGTIVNTAGGTVSGAAIVPYEDLEYSWNFGDPTGAELFLDPSVYPYAGISRNANNSQTGPEAAYCYRTAGSYTITLTIRAKNGAGGYTTAIKTLTFTVTDFSATFPTTYFIDGVNGNDSNNGTSSATPWKTIVHAKATIPNWGSLGPANMRIRLAQGSHFKFTDGDYFGNMGGISNSRFDDYVGSGGAGADPIIDMDGSPGTAPPYWINNSFGTPVSDVVVTNIHATLGVNATSTPNGRYASFAGSTQAFHDFYFDGCTFEDNSASASAQFGGQAITGVLDAGAYNTGYWVPNGKPGKSGATQIASAQFGNSLRWVFLMGGTAQTYGVTGGGYVLDHYWYLECVNHTLFRWINTLPLSGAGNLGSAMHTTFLNTHLGTTYGSGNDRNSYAAFSGRYGGSGDVFTQKGTKANFAALPAIGGATAGDFWITLDTGKAWICPTGNSAWVDLGVGIITSIAPDPLNAGFGILTVGYFGFVASANTDKVGSVTGYQIGQTLWTLGGSNTIPFSQGCVIVDDNSTDPTHLAAGTPVQGSNIFWQGRQYRVNNNPASMSCQDMSGVHAIEYGEFYCYDSCYIQGPDAAHAMGDPPQIGPQGQQQRNAVMQNCTMFGLNTGSNPGNCISITYRNNNFYGVLVNQSVSPSGNLCQYTVSTPADAVCSWRAYRNNVFGNGFAQLFVGANDPTSACPVIMTDNLTYDNRTNGPPLNIPYASLGILQANHANINGSGASLIDRNTYYGPNYPSGNCIIDQGGLISFATWQGFSFDVHGFNRAPVSPGHAWIDPANGNFNTP